MKLGSIASSSDPSKLSATIEGASILALSPTIVFVLKIFGLDIGESDVTQIITAILTFYGSIRLLFGLYRKFFIKPV